MSKVCEEEHKIRDILNVCYVITALYRRANTIKQTEEIEYINFEFMKESLK